MRYLPPIPWAAVALGTVVLDDRGVPRAVVGNIEDGARRLVLLDRDPRPHYVNGVTPISPIELDTVDAIGTLYATGLNPTPIGD